MLASLFLAWVRRTELFKPASLFLAWPRVGSRRASLLKPCPEELNVVSGLVTFRDIDCVDGVWSSDDMLTVFSLLNYLGELN